MRKSDHEDVTRALTRKIFHIRQQTDQSYVHRMSLRLATPLRGILPRLWCQLRVHILVHARSSRVLPRRRGLGERRRKPRRPCRRVDGSVCVVRGRGQQCWPAGGRVRREAARRLVSLLSSARGLEGQAMVGGRRAVGIVSSAVSLTWRPGLTMTAGTGPFLAALVGGVLLNVVAGRPGVVVRHCYRGAHLFVW